MIRRLRDKTNGSVRSTPSPVDSAECLAVGPRAGRHGCASSRKSYIKKPLNAFMLFMKQMRQRVIDECTLKESAAINQILGRKVCGVQVRWWWMIYRLVSIGICVSLLLL